MFQFIPTEVYHIIASYLSRKAYFRLLKCNKRIFSQVEFETICYYVDFSCVKDEYLDEYMEVLFQKVKDSSKQISLVICADNPSGTWCSNKKVRQFLWHGMGHSDIQCSLSFQSIRCLILDYVLLLKDLSLLQGSCRHSLEELELLNLWNLENIDHLKEFERLKDVTVYYCRSLVSVSVLKNMSCVSITGCPNLETDFLLTVGNHSSFSYDIYNRIVHSLPAFSNQLCYLSIRCACFDDNALLSCMSFLQNIPILKLSCSVRCEDSFPFSFFNGKKLLLNGFSEFNENLKFSSNLIYLSLIECKNFCCINEQSERFLVKLHSSQYNVQRQKEDQRKFIVLPRSLKTLILKKCDLTNDVSNFSFIEQVEIEKCFGMRSDTLHHSVSCRPLRRKISLNYMSQLVSLKMFSFCVYSLTLMNYGQFINGEELKDINILKFHYCRKLSDLSWFVNAKCLEIIGCPAVTSLKAVNAIPYLRIADCVGVESLDELEHGSNQFVVIKYFDEKHLLNVKEATKKYEDVEKAIPFFKMVTEDKSFRDFCSF
jgi:hypothetical protein